MVEPYKDTSLGRKQHPMAAKKGGGQRPVAKGFRPGKEPAHLKKQRAKAQLPKDATWAQKQAVEALAGRDPREVRRMVQKWSVGLMSAGVILAIVGVFLYGWAVPAGVAVHLLAAVVFILGVRVKRQGAGLVEMAERL